MVRYPFEVRRPGPAGSWREFTTVSRHTDIHPAIRSSVRCEEKARKSGEPTEFIVAFYDAESGKWSGVTNDERQVVWD